MRPLSYRSPQTIVKPSPIHGKGLFANSKIFKGALIAIKGGYIISCAANPELEDTGIQVTAELMIAPSGADDRDGAMLYTNHSCDPNIAIQGQIIFIALRDVEAGEELTHDWATTDNLDYQMACKCGSNQCRGIITGKDWMKKSIQQKYIGFFAWHIEQEIRKLHKK
jgi:hypothetical protein